MAYGSTDAHHSEVGGLLAEIKELKEIIKKLRSTVKFLEAEAGYE